MRYKPTFFALQTRLTAYLSFSDNANWTCNHALLHSSFMNNRKLIDITKNEIIELITFNTPNMYKE